MKTRLLLILVPLMILSPRILAQKLERGAYLQNSNPSAITICWRTIAPTDSVVRYGTVPGSLAQHTQIAGIRTEHEVRLSGLTPDTKYFYSVGTSKGPLAENNSYFFLTPPTEAKPTRIWVLGDAGTGNDEQLQVRDAYYKFTGTRHTDLWLMLGDNVADSGSDSMYASNLFAIYPSMLRKSTLWTTLGNHDAEGSNSQSQSGPYFDIFAYPKHGEAGGVPSGTEAYYSFNYGNIHLVCLDTADSSLTTSDPMAKWLIRDLRNNIKDWTIVFFHHSPYTKGNHNSDADGRLRNVRENFNPIFEDNGVDLVLSSHSHTYERSKFINGHYGKSETFNDKTMVKQSGSGMGTGAYTKSAMGPVPHQGTIYTVCGTGGESNGGNLDHPAMWISLESLGSMVLDIDRNRLTSTFLDNTGTIRDTYSIIKGDIDNPKPTVKITSPVKDASFVAPADISIRADAAETGGTIKKVAFYRGSMLLGTDISSPYRFVWKDVPAGNWYLTAIATDDRGNKRKSPVVKVRVKASAATLLTGKFPLPEDSSLHD